MQTRSNDGPIQYEDEIKTMTHTQFKFNSFAIYTAGTAPLLKIGTT